MTTFFISNIVRTTPALRSGHSRCQTYRDERDEADALKAFVPQEGLLFGLAFPLLSRTALEAEAKGWPLMRLPRPPKLTL